MFVDYRRPGRSGAGNIILLILLLAGMTSCATVPSVEAPEEFAVYDRTDAFVAVSPEGVRLRVRYEENDPEQDLVFWREALEIHLDRSGYAKLADDTFETPDGEGFWVEWVAPVGQDDWIYLTAIAVHEGQIAIAESAGPFQLYKKYREAIFDSLRSVTRVR